MENNSKNPPFENEEDAQKFIFDNYVAKPGSEQYELSIKRNEHYAKIRQEQEDESLVEH